MHMRITRSINCVSSPSKGLAAENSIFSCFCGSVWMEFDVLRTVGSSRKVKWLISWGIISSNAHSELPLVTYSAWRTSIHFKSSCLLHGDSLVKRWLVYSGVMRRLLTLHGKCSNQPAAFLVLWADSACRIGVGPSVREKTLIGCLA